MEYTLNTKIKTSAKEIYDTWLSSVGHSKMTGAPASVSDQVDGGFSAWDGYIQGSNLELDPGKKIVQAWRSADFGPNEADSRLEILLHEKNGETNIILNHTNVPTHGEQYIKGWDEHYFAPMKAYFSRHIKPTAFVTNSPL